MSVITAAATESLPTPPLPRGRPNLILTGFMGTGKTEAGRIVAQRLGMPFVDTDEVIATRAGQSVAEILHAEGEAGFRARERVAIADAAFLSGTLIATGGGAPLDRRSFDGLATTGHTLVLSASPDELVRRLGSGDGRPLLAGDPRAMVHELLARRAEVYAALGPPLDTTGRSVEQVAAEIAERYPALAAERTLRIELSTGDGTTTVVAGDGALEMTGRIHRALVGSERVAVVADAAVVETWAAAVAASLRGAEIEVVGPIPLPAGEPAKRIDVVAGLWDRLREEHVDPSCAVVAVGGGATLDAAGFAAATYARGIPLVNVPTTLLAMADAALGGKVAIDHAGAKNLVGSFHPARLVVVDHAVCASSPSLLRRQGLAEVAKAALLCSPLVLELLPIAPLGWAIEQSLRVKAAFVVADPRDRGVRRALNLGHTFAHAIEAASENSVPHGDAVAMGLVAAARLGALLGTCDAELVERVIRTLRALGLPTAPPDLQTERLRSALAADKKRARSETRFVVPAAGGAALVSGIDETAALALLRS